MLPIIRGGNRILDFDLEARPLSFWQPDKPTSEITAIAAAWADDPGSMKCWLLGRDDYFEMLNGFVALYNEANTVTGHYIRRFDLPLISGALLEAGLPMLGPKMTQDTKSDMPKKDFVPATQEFLSDTLGVPYRKFHMTQTFWRTANRLTPDGLALTEKRVTDDVRQHMKLRLAMIEHGYLGPARAWRP